MQISERILDMSRRPAPPRTPGGLAAWQERRAKALLEAQLESNVGLAAVARACNLSCGHFSRAFRQSTGEPPYRWLIARRVARAQQMLVHPGQSLTEIALACGFADQSHFSRVFHKATGMAPGAWRRAQSLPVALAG